MKKINAGKLARRIIIYILIITLVIVFLMPVYGVVTLSLKSLGELAKNYWGLPREWRFDNFDYVWNNPIAGIKYYFANTFKITIPSVIISIFISALMAYPLAKLKIKGGRVIFFIVLFGLTIPHQILIIPVFKTLNLLHLYNTTTGMVWVHSAYGIPFCTFVLRNFMIQIPSELEDASKIDGCNDLGSFWRIILPLCKPALAVLVILQFTWIYNDFFYAVILTSGKEVAPVTVAISLLKSGPIAMRWEVRAAASIIATLPTMIVFLFFQRYFIKGIMLGSVKG